MWTLFWDMNSGGGRKEKHSLIFIEAEQEEAELVFYNRFGHNPNRVSCTCCGADYSISSHESLEQLSGFHRGCEHSKDGYVEEPGERFSQGWEYQTIEEFAASDKCLIIRSAEISTGERCGNMPEEGFVWK